MFRAWTSRWSSIQKYGSNCLAVIQVVLDKSEMMLRLCTTVYGPCASSGANAKSIPCETATISKDHRVRVCGVCLCVRSCWSLIGAPSLFMFPGFHGPPESVQYRGCEPQRYDVGYTRRAIHDVGLYISTEMGRSEEGQVRSRPSRRLEIYTPLQLSVLGIHSQLQTEKNCEISSSYQGRIGHKYIDFSISAADRRRTVHREECPL